MSALWTAADAARATGGSVAGDWRASGLSIDSRTLRPGDLFVAVAGARDGHDFVADALERGAAAALVSRTPAGVDASRLLVVDDTQRGLEALGAAGRARSTARSVGITGSVGKTGSKAALAHGLRRLGSTHASIKSFNNYLGVPLSLAELPDDAAFAVFEMGMNRAGEIAGLTRQVRPHGCLITAIAPAHIAFFDDESGIARAKAEIFEGVEPEGFAVIPAASPHTPLLEDAAERAGIERVVRFGDGGDARVEHVEPDALGSTVVADLAGTPARYRIGLPGAHWVANSLGLLAVVEAMGLDVAAVAASFAELRPEPGRGLARRIDIDGGEAVLLDDSYNANPASMRAALAVLGLAQGRKLAALGEMKELGARSRDDHAALAEPVQAAGVARVFTAGDDMEALRNALPKRLRAAHGATADDLVDAVRAELRPGDTLLVKGSLASGMGRLVRALVGEAT